MDTIATALVQSFTEKGETLAVAESCTGGLIGSLLTDVPGSSRVFPGGVVAYGNRPKREVLGIDAELLFAHGAVSAEAASAMAEAVRGLLHTDAGLGVTGIAGPTGGSAQKPIGTVFIACASATGTVVERHRWTGDRETYKHKTALAALELAMRHTSSA